MSLYRPVNANQLLSNSVISVIFHIIWCDVIVIVATLSVVTVAVSVLHA